MKLNEIIGQDHIKKDVYVHILYNRWNATPMEHTLLFGQAGLGKTTLVNAIAEELERGVIMRTGQELSRKEIIGLLTNIAPDEILFIDEIHDVPVKSMEILYGPMQIINDMKLANTISTIKFEGLKINPFTLIGATTIAGKITKPLFDRMILKYYLKVYTERQLSKILEYWGCPIKSAVIIAKRARGVPRIALNYFSRIRNEAMVVENITEKLCEEVFGRLGIRKDGFDETDLAIIAFLKKNGVSSEHTICEALGIDTLDYRNIYEPFLINKGLIKVGARGRQIC